MKSYIKKLLWFIAILLVTSCSSDEVFYTQVDGEPLTRTNEEVSYEISRDSARVELIKLLQDIDGVQTRSLTYSGIRTISSEYTYWNKHDKVG